MSNPADLHLQLKNARELLKQAQLRVTELESQLNKGIADDTSTIVSVSDVARLHDSSFLTADETGQSSDDRFRLFMQSVNGYAIYFLDTTGHVISWNTGAERLKQYTSEEITGQNFERFFTSEDREAGKPEKLLAHAALHGFVEDEGWRVRKDGSQFWANVVITALHRADGTLNGFGKITRDLTERKRSEEQVGKLFRTLSVLSDINQMIVRTRDLHELFNQACHIAVEKGGFRMAWIAFFDPANGRLEPAAHVGTTATDLQALALTLNGTQFDTHPIAAAVRAGERWLCNDLHDSACPGDINLYGAGSSIALPLVAAGVVRGLIQLYAEEVNFFDDAELRLMSEMAMDVSFAIEVSEQETQRLEAEAKVKRYAQRMEILHEIDMGITQATSVEAIVKIALQQIRILFACDQAVVALFDFGANELDVFSFDMQTPFEELNKRSRFPIRPGLLDDFRTSTLNVIDDIFEITDGPPEYEPLKQWGLHSSLRALLMFQGLPIGIIALTAAPAYFFTPELQQIAVEIANQLAIAIRERQLAADLAQHSAQLEQTVAERTADLQAVVMRVEAILNNSPDGIVLVHRDLYIQQTNLSFNRLFHCEQDDYFSLPLSTLIHEDDADAVTDVVQSAIAEGREKRIEIRVIQKDGVAFEAELSVGPIQGDGLVCLLHDITERKRSEAALSESEEKFRSLAETMRGGLAMFDTDYRITYINERFCELLGYSREECIGKRPTDFIFEQDVLMVREQLGRRRKLESSSYELAMRHKNGHPVHLLMSGSPMSDKNGQFNGSFVVVTDIAMQKQAEAALQQALSKERELSDLKSRFISMASHEFRTPLATILVLVDTISIYRNRLNEEQIEQRFEKIRGQIKLLQNIMDDVLMLARIQARRVAFSPVELNLDDLCRRIIDDHVNHPDFKHDVKYQLTGESRSIRIDEKLMRQVVGNLLSNAIKYSVVEQTIIVALSFETTSVTLKISDQGIGIPESDLPHLFEPFHRAANVGTISGTGLGLVIAKEAVELHGGSIVVESQPGVGTTFTIHIPTVQSEKPDA